MGPTVSASELLSRGSGRLRSAAAVESAVGGEDIAGGALSGRGSLLHARSAASSMTLWRLVGLRGGFAEVGRCCRGDCSTTGRQLQTGISSLGIRLGRDLDTHRLQRSCTETHRVGPNMGR